MDMIDRAKSLNREKKKQYASTLKTKKDPEIFTQLYI